MTFRRREGDVHGIPGHVPAGRTGHPVQHPAARPASGERLTLPSTKRYCDGTMPPIEITPEFKRALSVMEGTRKNLLLTGRAGTGKSTLLRHFRDNTDKNAVVLAPTGVAAVNIEGQTIHSFFGFKPGIVPEAVRAVRRNSVYRELETLVIDEISMVRADLLDCMDRFMRLNGREKREPFGGAQVVMIGDLYQIPPVVTPEERGKFAGLYESPYFFSAGAFKGLPVEFVELERVFRQKDDAFIALLNSVRNGTVTEQTIDAFNTRVDPAFAPEAEAFCICLTTTNAAADGVNAVRLAKLKGSLKRFTGEILGDFDEKYLPVPMVLELKKGAQVMMAKNDPEGRWVNGTVAQVHGFGGGSVLVEWEEGGRAEVEPVKWDNYDFEFNPSTKRVEAESVGSYTQYPMKLAWAVTIHKAQGKTFDRVLVDFGRGTFAGGQAYVALSRCTTLGGLHLKRPLRKSDVRLDWRIVKFLTGFQWGRAAAGMSVGEKRRMIEEAIGAKSPLDMVYLKASDEKSRRQVVPREVGMMEYLGKEFLGMRAWCRRRREERVFRLDRILELSPVKKERGAGD